MINMNATTQVVRMAQKAVAHKVKAPKCVRDGLVTKKDKMEGIKFKNNGLRGDIGMLLELGIKEDENRVYASNVGRYSIEVVENPTTVTSYVYKDEDTRNDDLTSLLSVLNLM